MEITQVIKQKINKLISETNKENFEKLSGLSLDEILAKTEFSANDLVAICKGLDVELVEFFADSSFELKAFN